ncbi:MAG: pantoate--beta-alanine ligase [Coriobacteriia bacterium]|nr:pantoate--beta-alanine ligase [Coriobacteriia bacterium]
MERIASKDEMRAAIAEARRGGKTVGLVPTMGALHRGHLSLVAAARERTDVVVVSIFVNPTQFAPGEDFESYPRRVDEDVEMLGDGGVDLVFTPSVETMYAGTPLVTVDPGPLARRWEGEVRPGHFAGVATIVTKLFGIIRPDLAFFGEKDFQQLTILKRMALDLDLGVGVIGCPVVRDIDGLALSSRNAYLSVDERDYALALPEALEAAAQALAWGEHDATALGIVMREAAGTRAPGALTLDYAAIVDPETLEPLETVDRPARAIIAGRVGKTRLIDNCALAPSPGGAE